MRTFPYSNGHTDANRRAQFEDRDKTTLGNCLRVAAERFDEYAKTFNALIDYKPDPESMMQIHGEGARRSAMQFEDQAREAREYADVIENADQLLDILYEADEKE